MADRTLANEALANLVDQFARPLDFLRELVQNALDAGTPRIEVRATWSAPDRLEDDGLLALSVRDFGEGMNRDVIEHQLTRLFASEKEGDLTKIGKFGIGFASVFALRPDAVRVRTGRLGEAWEVLFHADHSWELTPLSDALAGTEVTVIRRMSAKDRDLTVREARFVLGYWCEHTNRPVSFHDETKPPDPSPIRADPFAAFSAAPTPDTVSTPLALHTPLVAQTARDGVTALVGITLRGTADSPRYGFYNGGLTLLSTQDAGCLGDLAPQLAHLTFKVQSGALEHTLTRDNVLHDDGWRRTMAVVLEARDLLRAQLITHLVALAAADAALGSWHGALADEVALAGPTLLGDEAPVFRDAQGTPRCLTEVERQEDDVGVILVDGGQRRLAQAVAAQGMFSLEDHPQTRRLLHALGRSPLLGLFERLRTVRTASERFTAPEPVATPPGEAALLADVTALLQRVGVESVRLGAFGGATQGAGEPLALRDPNENEHVVLRHASARRASRLIVNRNHPWWQSQRLIAVDRPGLAAAAAAHGIGHAISLSERHMRTLIDAATA